MGLSEFNQSKSYCVPWGNGAWLQVGIRIVHFAVVVTFICVVRVSKQYVEQQLFVSFNCVFRRCQRFQRQCYECSQVVLSELCTRYTRKHCFVRTIQRKGEHWFLSINTHCNLLSVLKLIGNTVLIHFSQVCWVYPITPLLRLYSDLKVENVSEANVRNITFLHKMIENTVGDFSSIYCKKIKCLFCNEK